MKRSFLTVFLVLVLCAVLSGCGGATSESIQANPQANPQEPSAPKWESLSVQEMLVLEHADQFSVAFYKQGYSLVTIGDTESEQQQFLLVPEGQGVPEGLPADVTALYRPLDQIYLVSTSSMDSFRALDSVDAVTLTGTQAKDWYIDEARNALEEGRMTYAGKYSAPDYELILSKGCDLAVENTMIYHSPEVKEQLEGLGIPVMVDRSSYERNPLGRVEWVKLYGALLGKNQQAAELYDTLTSGVDALSQQESTGKTVSFFYITTTGAVNLRKSGDYVTKSIALAGGQNLTLDEGEENALSTMNVQMESFYATAKDADCLIYNSTIDGELNTLDDLLQKSELLSDFKAVQTGNVWCASKNLFQQPLSIGALIADVHTVLTQDDPNEQDLTFLRRLR